MFLCMYSDEEKQKMGELLGPCICSVIWLLGVASLFFFSEPINIVLGISCMTIGAWYSGLLAGGGKEYG